MAAMWTLIELRGSVSVSVVRGVHRRGGIWGGYVLACWLLLLREVRDVRVVMGCGIWVAVGGAGWGCGEGRGKGGGFGEVGGVGLVGGEGCCGGLDWIGLDWA